MASLGWPPATRALTHCVPVLRCWCAAQPDIITQQCTLRPPIRVATLGYAADNGAVAVDAAVANVAPPFRLDGCPNGMETGCY